MKGKKKKEKLGYIKNCAWERNDSDTDFIFFFFKLQIVNSVFHGH